MKRNKEFVDENTEHVRKLLEEYLKGGHRMPKTRREFLSSGLISASTFMFLPAMAQLISQSAWGSECVSASPDNSLPAFINIQLAGGPALYANHLACGANGALDQNYATLGVGSSPGVQRFFSNNAPFWMESDASIGSQMMRAINSRIAGDSSLLNNSAFVAIAAKSLDDTANNPTNISGMLEKIGLVGSTFPYFITGEIFAGFSKPAIIPAANTLAVVNLASLQSSLGFKGALGGFSTNVASNLDIQRRLVASIETLSKHQIEKLVAQPNSDASQQTYRDLMKCALEKNNSVINGATNVNIYDGAYPGGTGFASIWALDQAATFNPVVERVGQSVVSCIRGQSGATIVSLGGYDYHLGNTRTGANEKDRQLGDLIGRILRTAKAANRKTFIYVSADGAVGGAAIGDPTANWTSDFGERGMQYIIAYDPAKAPSTQGLTVGNYQDASFQLNHFSSTGARNITDGVVATGNPIAGSDAQDLCASAVFLNYLSFAGQSNKIDMPELAAVKARLQSAVPAQGKDIFNYFLRIVS
jgi:hypothetical protein